MKSNYIIGLKRQGDSYSVAKGPSGISKAKNKLRKPARIQFSVDEVTFSGATDIYFARIPVQGPGGHPSYVKGGQGIVARHHFVPPVVHPAVGNPHWVKDNQHPVSWPAAYVRDGAPGGPHARGLRATFSATRNFNGQREIRAIGPNNITTNTITVAFNGGYALPANFTFTALPNTVQCLAGIELRWQGRPPGPGGGAFVEFGRSRHTLYLLDAAPLPALGAGEQHYFEVVDWACRWASGQAGPANVLAQILARFQPVQANHASRLIYWRNHQAGVPPAQSVAAAIQYQDHGIGERKASSCRVFDLVFLNCLAIHGVQAAEIELRPAQYLTPLQPAPLAPLAAVGFVGMNPYGGLSYYWNALSWAAATVVAHGNPGAPDGWNNHWVAAVNTGAGPTGWQLYDPSYGLGPYDLAAAPAMAGGALAIPAGYETHGVQHFPCNIWSDDGVNIAAPRIDNLPSANPHPPHLVGTVLTIN